MRRNGFTLIELLVVIAIIAILAAILFPVFAKAREKGRQASCLSNVKQIMIGVLQYAQDYDEQLPYGCSYWFEPGGGGTTGTGAYTDAIMWEDAIAPYLKNSQILICPSRKSCLVTTKWDTAPATHPVDYAANMCFQQFGYQAIANLKDTSRYVFLIERASLYYFYWYGTNQLDPALLDSGNHPWYDADMRHNDGCNMGFLDGHAKWANGGMMKAGILAQSLSFNPLIHNW
jgi:prepilin-type N-terminal cleavage/methylation domain-containing protein/prepilin-type processing-associated H-X9-DG protein